MNKLQRSIGYALVRRKIDDFMAQVGLLEDNPRIAKLCVTLLHYAGHEVTVYETSEKCLHALLNVKFNEDLSTTWPSEIDTSSLPVEVLILDLFLPDIDGIDVLRCLTSHPHTQALPLILCTAAPGAELDRARHVAPHVGIVEKPFRLQTLVTAISAALATTVK